MVIAEDSCSLTSLQTRQACWSCLSKSERTQLKVYLLLAIYQEVVGSLSFADAQQNSACIACEPDSVLDGFEVTALLNLASSEGVQLNSADIANATVAELKDAMKCYACANPKLLRAMESTLRCAIYGSLSAPVIL